MRVTPGRRSCRLLRGESQRKCNRRKCDEQRGRDFQAEPSSLR
jgi:hypothetical protein